MIHPLEQPQKTPVAETFSSCCLVSLLVFLALVDTCSCLNHFMWLLQLHRTLPSSSLSFGGLQGKG